MVLVFFGDSVGVFGVLDAGVSVQVLVKMVLALTGLVMAFMEDGFWC